MADFYVVAIFMPYIGFSDILKNWLVQLENMADNVEILTSDNSSLGAGFILFLVFSIGNQVISSILGYKLKKH